jgi:hypothetical protein
MMPCSRVSHVFGGMGGGCPWPGRSPNAINKWRAIKVWMDEYADIMRQYLPGSAMPQPAALVPPIHITFDR